MEKAIDEELSAKVLLVSLGLSGLYLIIGYKWFYSFIFGSILDSWAFTFVWPIYRYMIVFALLFLIPWYIWRKIWKQKLRSIGWQWGNRKWGLILSIIGAFAIIGIGFSTAADPSFAMVYPYERVFVDPAYGQFNVWGFLVFEAMYVVLYYIPYEFFFRGFLQFPNPDKNRSKILTVLLSTTITTIIHWDAPNTELFAALAVGFVYGFVALGTKSIFYGLINHIAVGLTTNIVCVLILQGVI